MLQIDPKKLAAVTADNIGELVGMAEPVLRHRRTLYAQYTRKEKATEFMGERARPEKIVPFEYYIVNMVQGYLGGKAPMYRVMNPAKTAFPKKSAASPGRQNGEKERYIADYTDAIDYIRRYNDDGATFIELIHDYIITTAAYLYIYENSDNQIVYTRYDSRQTVGFFDYSTPPNQIGSLRCWSQEDAAGNEQTVAELISPTPNDQKQYLRRLFMGGAGGYQEAQKEMLSWGEDVPVVSFENPDAIAVFEPALSSISTYEQLVNNVSNMTQYNDRDAKLKIVNYPCVPEQGSSARAELDDNLMRARTLFVDDKGDAGWLLKPVDYEGTLSVEKNLHDTITMLTGVPNLTDEAFSNADNASALGYKLYALDQYSATTDRVFRRGYLRLWEIVTNRLNLKGADFDFRDIEIVMQRNIPTDRDKSIDRAIRLKTSGLSSHQTALDESSLEVDAVEEIERIDAEQDRDFERIQQRNRESGDETADEDIGMTE